MNSIILIINNSNNKDKYTFFFFFTLYKILSNCILLWAENKLLSDESFVLSKNTGAINWYTSIILSLSYNSHAPSKSLNFSNCCNLRSTVAIVIILAL